MPETTDPLDLESGDGTPPEGTTDPATAGDGTKDADGQAPDANDAELRKTRREAQALRKRLREFEEAEQARKDAELTESERKDNRIKELEAAREADAKLVRDTRLLADVGSAASRLGIVDPDAAFKLLDHSGLDYDDDAAKWTGVDEALTALTAEKPWLVGAPAAATAGSNANPSNPSRPRSTLTIADLKKMSAAELRELPPDQLNAVLTAGK